MVKVLICCKYMTKTKHIHVVMMIEKGQLKVIFSHDPDVFY